MRNSWTRLTLASAIVAATSFAPAQAQTKLTSGTSYRNELGSVLTIDSIASNGLMSGTYVTATGCSAGTPQPMTGWYYAGNTGGAITFSVNWQGCNSVTSWSGQFNYQTGQFQTLWYLTLASAPAWNGINAGTDIFVPIGSAAKK